MGTQPANIIARLQQDILLLQGFKPASLQAGDNGGLSLIKEAFPNASFPLGAIHEYVCSNAEEASASAGFISGIISSIMKESGVIAWIGSGRSVFPHALQMFGISPHRVLFIETRNEKENLWITEEALKCDALSAVVADIKDLGFTESRRFQLAVEQSGVTGFLLRRNLKISASCSVTRWQIQPVMQREDEIPGVGFPQWNVQLVKVRNGKPSTWQMEWKAGGFHHILKSYPQEMLLRKVV